MHYLSGVAEFLVMAATTASINLLFLQLSNGCQSSISWQNKAGWLH